MSRTQYGVMPILRIFKKIINFNLFVLIQKAHVVFFLKKKKASWTDCSEQFELELKLLFRREKKTPKDSNQFD